MWKFLGYIAVLIAICGAAINVYIALFPCDVCPEAPPPIVEKRTVYPEDYEISKASRSVLEQVAQHLGVNQNDVLEAIKQLELEIESTKKLIKNSKSSLREVSGFQSAKISSVVVGLHESKSFPFHGDIRACVGNIEHSAARNGLVLFGSINYASGSYILKYAQAGEQITLGKMVIQLDEVKTGEAKFTLNVNE